MTVLTSPPPPPPPRIPLREMAERERERAREIESGGGEKGRKIIESRERFIIIEALRPPRSLGRAAPFDRSKSTIHLKAFHSMQWSTAFKIVDEAKRDLYLGTTYPHRKEEE